MLVYVRPSNEAYPILDLAILREWPRLPFTARIERAHSYRARSASKKGTWPLPAHPSQGARSGSTGPTWVSFPSLQACSFSLQGWGLIDLPLRASNDIYAPPKLARISLQRVAWLILNCAC